MKGLQGIVLAAVLLVAVLGVYFLYAGFGFATAIVLEVTVSGDTITPPGFSLGKHSRVMIRNTNPERAEIEIRRAGNVVVWRRDVFRGMPQVVRLDAGAYTVHFAQQRAD